MLAGIPYEKEAEFSPDGSNLVYISDAGLGVDNIWTMPYTTCKNMARMPQQQIRESAVQQTNSTFLFSSSPAFHPTEPKVIATKWFLTGRPSGADEIWEVPLRVSDDGRLPERGGRRIISRKLPTSWSKERYFESQLGSEQARYTPSDDGIVFSRNLRDDAEGKFSYNKDVHSGINAVFLLNTTTNETTTLVSATPSKPDKPASPGGANVPRLSSDGRTLAFIRRRNDKEVLGLKDMRSGTLHYVWDGLSYDLSTIPAFMGAYPNYGWSENARRIVIWSQGQIWSIPLRVNHFGERVANGDPKQLGFRAAIDIALGTTRYSTTNITAHQLATHAQETALRGLRSDAKGKAVVFEGAGDNYVMDVSSGDIQKIGAPNAVTSCYAPSFVDETQSLLKSCWNDVNYTSFHLVNRQDNTTTEVQGLPRGRCVSPVTDGRINTYIRTGKDYMFGDIDETFGEGVWVANIYLPATPSGTSWLNGLRRLPLGDYSAESKFDMGSRDGSTIILI